MKTPGQNGYVKVFYQSLKEDIVPNFTTPQIIKRKIKAKKK